MATELRMPMLGEVMEQGTVVAWHKREGDRVEKGEIIIDVEMDKGITPVESTVSGVLAEILVPEGKTVPVNTPLAIIE